jgi:HAD superfamily hydrolase (TIGR01509 family)
LPNRPVIFLDDGGVMNDNSLRGPQWERMVGEFFTPLFGGTPQAWAEANRHMMHSMFLVPGAWDARMLAAPDYATFDRQYQLDWINTMFERVGIEPPSPDESVALGKSASKSIMPRVKSAYPDAIDTIRLLHNRGYTLNTSSGTSSEDMECCLSAMGVRDCFGRLYGPDLVGVFKNGPEFYRRLLADAGVSPSDALILDDTPKIIGWIEEAGARAVLVGDPTNAPPGITHVISSLAELPAFIERMYQ